MWHALASAIDRAPVHFVPALVGADDVLFALALARVLIEVLVHRTLTSFKTNTRSGCNVPVSILRAFGSQLAADTVIDGQNRIWLRRGLVNEPAAVQPLVRLADWIRLVRPTWRRLVSSRGWHVKRRILRRQCIDLCSDCACNHQ